MTRLRGSRISIVLILVAVLVLPATVAFADSPAPVVPPPIAVIGPRLAPPPIPVSGVIAPSTVYNNSLVAPYLPPQSVEANAADAGRHQQAQGRGIRQTATSIGYGIQLKSSTNVCNDFNGESTWASTSVPKDVTPKVRTDVWTDWYAGWAPFAVDDGLYQAKNVTFSMERVVGPGNEYGPSQQSMKIHADNQPYAAGVGSPLIAIPDGFAGGKVLVKVKYLIWDHDQGGAENGADGMDYDWASMGVKADAYGKSAVYVNGYVRGEWAELTNEVSLVRGAKYIMVLLQGQSPGSFNSTVYFDNVEVYFLDKAGTATPVKDCKFAQ